MLLNFLHAVIEEGMMWSYFFFTVGKQTNISHQLLATNCTNKKKLRIGKFS